MTKLLIDKDDAGYRLAWVVDDDLGACVGDIDESTPERDWGDDRDVYVAALAARKTAGAVRRRDGYVWETRDQAQDALRAVRVAIKADEAKQAGKSWPDWAIQAQTAGWKPPKGWKP